MLEFVVCLKFLEYILVKVILSPSVRLNCQDYKLQK